MKEFKRFPEIDQESFEAMSRNQLKDFIFETQDAHMDLLKYATELKRELIKLKKAK